MFSFGPFLPHPDTPLCYAPAPTEDDVLKILALSRLMKPKDTKVLITTAFETLSKNARKSGLMSGGTSVMLNATPMQLRNLYSIYPNRAHEKETIEFQVKEIASLLKSIGRVPVDLGTGVGNLS
jgi:biotin synthase